MSYHQNQKKEFIALNIYIHTFQQDFYHKICEMSTENTKLVIENKKLKSCLYEYRLNAYNKLSSDDSSCSSSTDSDVPLQVVTNKPRSKKRKAKAKTKTVAPTIPLSVTTKLPWLFQTTSQQCLENQRSQ